MKFLIPAISRENYTLISLNYFNWLCLVNVIDSTHYQQSPFRITFCLFSTRYRLPVFFCHKFQLMFSSLSFYPSPSLCLSVCCNYPVYLKGKTFPSYSPVTVTRSSVCVCLCVLSHLRAPLYLFYLSYCTGVLVEQTQTDRDAQC